ncbi:MAG: glycosyltransferase family 4 protein [Sphingobacteriaceae bacterium]|nr:MAG: glycosyltransferase family 4 protein [Sphingobacteriaceae bacterium]
MHIAVIADPEIPVPPLYYGGIERVIDLLIKGLKKSGHTISLFAHPDSVTNADHFFAYRGTDQSRLSLIKNTFLVSKLLLNPPDVVHSFGRLAYLSALLPTKTPKIMSYQREPTLSQIKKAVKFAGKNSMYFTGCSNYITNQFKAFAPASTVYNAVSTDNYQFKNTVDDDAPLVFLGRIEPIKGAHTAIKVAKQANRKLILAGNIPPEASHYFDNEVAPFIDQKTVCYIGEVNDLQKNELLGNAAALLMPIEWNEPFGIVMAEALACGTPVIAFDRGAAKEVVINGTNGWLCRKSEDMVNAVARLNQINRMDCRMDAETRFSADALVNRFEKLYFELIQSKSNSKN